MATSSLILLYSGLSSLLISPPYLLDSSKEGYLIITILQPLLKESCVSKLLTTFMFSHNFLYLDIHVCPHFGNLFVLLLFQIFLLCNFLTDLLLCKQTLLLGLLLSKPIYGISCLATVAAIRFRALCFGLCISFLSPRPDLFTKRGRCRPCFAEGPLRRSGCEGRALREGKYKAPEHLCCRLKY